MEFLELAKKRYSVREYTDRQVEKEKLDQILRAAQAAPTACNRQPVHLLVVQSLEGLEKIGKAANLHGAPMAVLVCGDKDKAWTRPYDGKQSVDIDASIVTDHMMLEATDLGVGSLWICSFKPDVLREEFSLPENLEVINILVLYRPAKYRKEKNRKEKTGKAAVKIMAAFTLPFYRISFPINGSHFP